MRVKGLFSTFSIILLLSALLAIGIASAQDVLRLDEHRSYVWTETGEKIPYVDFLNTDQFEGDVLEFRIYVSKTGVPIPDNYVLELRTNMDKLRDWKFGDDIYHSASVIVWQGKNEHAYPFPSPIILTGVVPEPIRQVKEPGFEKYNIVGIGKDEVYVELTVGTSRDGATLETIQQKLSPSMKFFSTDEGIKAAKMEIEKNLEEARGKIGRTDLEEDIWELYEEGHPGWASKLSAHYKELIMERFENYFAEEKQQKGNNVETTDYLHVRNITDWNNPLDLNNLIFTMHPPDERVNPPYDVGKIIDGPKTDNQYGYTWWKIEWDNGEVGWSVEGPFDKSTEKWLVKTDKTPIKIRDLEDPFNYQGEYELNQTELRAEETKEEVIQNVTKYANEYKISPALIMAIIRQESDFNVNAKGDYWNGEYHSFGYMQVSYGAANDTYMGFRGDEYKGTEEEWKNDGLDPETNIKYGVRYLRILHDRIKDGCSGYEDVYGDILKSTISAYNAGHPTLTNRRCYVLGGRCNGQYAGVIEGKSVNGEHRGYKFFLSNRIPTAKPVIAYPLEITAKDIYYVEDTLAAKFTITNRAAKSVTFDVLVVGGRDPTGEVVDFDKTYAVTLNPGDSYDYEGYLILPDKPGIYHFFCAYHTEEHMLGEDEYNWNTNIDVEIDGKIVEDFSEAKIYRERDIIVFEETYISPAPPPVLWEEIDGPWDSWPTSLGNWNEAPQIDVNPNNPNEIYLEAIHRTNNWWEDQGGKLYKSTDGGDSWIPVNHGLPRLTLSDYYWPIRAIAIAPSNPDIIYVGSSDLNPYSSLLPSAKGIYKSTNGGSEWTSVGGPYTGKWIFKTYCSISSIVVNPIDPDTVYAGTVGGGIWRTTNGGESWERIWDEPVHKETLLDVNALAISPANPNTIYAAAYNFNPVNAMGWSGILIPNRFIKSEDGGDTWERLRLGILTAAPKIDDIAVDYKNADIVYVITEHYKVYNSTDGGKNWDDASGTGGSNPLPYVFRPWSLWKSGSMSIHPDYSNVIYASGEWGFKYVYFSSDSGENWFPFRDLKDKHVKEIVLASNADSRVIYAAAIEGLFKVDISNSVPSDGNYRLTWVYETDASPNCVSVASDGGYIAVGSPDGLYLLDHDKNLIWAYQTDFPIVDVSMTADVSHIVAGGSEGIVIPDGVVYCLNTQGELLWSTEPNGVSSVSLSPDGNYFAMTYVHGLGWNDVVALWGFNEEQWLWHYTFGRDETGAVSVSADGEYIAVGGAAMLDDGAVRLYNKVGDLLWEYATDTTTLGGDKYSVSISSDGKYIAAGNQRNNNLYFFDRDQKLLWSYNTGYVKGVSSSSDGNYIVAASSDKIYLFDRYKNLLWTYEINNIKDVSMSADADMIVAVTEDNKVYAFTPAHVLKNIRFGYQSSTHQIVHINASEYNRAHPDEAAKIFARETGCDVEKVKESFVPEKGESYNHTIRAGSYPQIHHVDALSTANGWINCTEFSEANGKCYNDWISAIKLFL